MKSPLRKFYCDDEDYYVGGVCEGIARTLNIDVESVRIFTVILTILTFGVLGIAYLVLYIMLPKKHEYRPVDVTPTEVKSDKYNQVVGENSAIPPTEKTTDDTSVLNALRLSRTARSERKRDKDAATGHMPPPAPGRATPHAYAPTYAELSKSEQSRRSWALFAVFVAIVVAVTFMNMGVDVYTDHFRSGKFFPLILVGWGIVRMVVPDKNGKRTWTGSFGFFLALIGAMLFLETSDTMHFAWVPWLHQGVLLLAASLAMVAFGRVHHSMIMMACGLALFITFCGMGIFFFGIPGNHYAIWMPLGIGEVPFV